MGTKTIKKSQKIVFFDFPGHPFVHDLTRSLSKNKSNKIYHLYNPKQLGPKSNFSNNKFEKIITIPKKFSRNFYIRFFDELVYSFYCIYHLFKIKPDVLIVSSMPLIPLGAISITKKIMSFNLVFWVQDIQSLAIERILSRRKNMLAKIISKIFYTIECLAIKSSDSVILITEDFIKFFAKELKSKKVYVINNWGSFETINPKIKNNSFTIEHKINDSFNILYSGTLGYKHNPDILLNLSIYLQKKKMNAKLIIISEGPVVDYLKSKSKKMCLKNIVFLPFQDFDIFPEVLSSSEASLVLLEKDSSDFCVPSKFLSILCAQRIPIVNTDKNNLVSKIIKKHDCGIIASDQDQINKSVESLVKNYESFKYLGDNGYKYAKQNFRINYITKEFEKIIAEQ